MRIEIADGAPRDAFLLISENYYKDWQATAYGHPVPVVLGNAALMTVPVSAGTRVVELEFVSPEYRVGKVLTILSLLSVGCGLLLPPFLRSRQRA